MTAHFVAAVAGASSEWTSGSLSGKEGEGTRGDGLERSLAPTSLTTAVARIWQVSQKKQKPLVQSSSTASIGPNAGIIICLVSVLHSKHYTYLHLEFFS